MEYMGYFLIAVIFLFLLVKVFTWPMKLLLKLLANAVLGVILLLIVDFFGTYFNFRLELNIANILISGLLGVPGVIFLIIFKLYL